MPSCRALPSLLEAYNLRTLVLSWRALPSSREAHACAPTNIALAPPGMDALHGLCMPACELQLSSQWPLRLDTNLAEMAVGVAHAHFSRLPCCAHTLWWHGFIGPDIGYSGLLVCCICIFSGLGKK